jgi:OOP family OmpA-OmpF porin
MKQKKHELGLYKQSNRRLVMNTQLKRLAVAIVPLMISAPALAEKGFVYEGANKGSVVRTGYGECWTTSYRDAGPIDPTCYGDADGDGVVDPMDKCPDTPKGDKVDEAGCTLILDADGDGVMDDKDQCPGTPRGAAVDAIGCELDSDGDGVVDANDSCPGTPKGASVDASGCALDSDRDGVADYSDKCRNTPAGAKVDSEGCAREIILENVRFELNKGDLTADSKEILDKVAASLIERKDIQNIQVIGHTDSLGSSAYNQSLSEKRAKTVAGYMIYKGVDETRISSTGMGESQPIADNGTKEGRARNRRVELQVR